MPKTQGLFLCFDFGTQYIGTAIGHSLSQSARPLVVLPAKAGQPHWDSIAGLLKNWQPQGLVVGHPLTLDGKAEAIALKAQQFGEALAARFHLPVYFADESFTTQLAKSMHRSDARVDAIAAALILEGWLKSLSLVDRPLLGLQ